MKDTKPKKDNYSLLVARYSLLLIVFVFIAACGGKKEVKQVSQESKTSQEAFALAETIRAAYLKKDFTTIADKCTRSGYKDIFDSIKHFDSAELSFSPRWVEIDKSKVYINIAWNGKWTVDSNTVKERGLAVFQLEGTPLRLTRIARGNPFKYPER